MSKVLDLFGALCVLAVVYSTVSVTARHVSKDVQPQPGRNIQCWGRDPMIGNAPNPLNCYKFYTCVPAPPESNAATVPEDMNCPMGANGRPLFYDFRNCSCQYDNSVCFDAMVDQEDFFICAKKYDPAEWEAVSTEPVPRS